ncbi:tripartite tricarboxylate transporter substrate binding protein [Oceanobacillus saliphilus]|uniref:tripartite tricarboxylate transporter substrate binding protein n=1 Tax=Oceanobacillus saliphilus TaxID=2925834 RepID=UPI00201DC59D|nr:tripartite tricarboxylate transporter substrate binding protein [Oceanobacillus saliphilus]
MKRKKLFYFTILLLLITSLLAACGDNANSEDATYPDKSISMIVPFSAGGPGDVMTREVASIAEEFFGQTVVVENKPGGSGSVALNHTINQEADGYTIMNHSSTLPQTMASGEIPFTPDDVIPVATMVSNYHVLAVMADSPFQTFEDFVEYAKENPGELNVVGSNTNGANHVFSLKVMDGAEIDFNYVAYDGGGEALTRLLGGNADAIGASGEVVQQQVEAGEVRILAVSSSERVPLHPDIPTFKELGLENVDDELIWRGFFVKPGTPEDVIEEIQDVLKSVTESEEFAEYAEKTNQDIYFVTGEELETILNDIYNESKDLFERYK